jgi:predicted phage terminase large subunit-like protein
VFLALVNRTDDGKAALPPPHIRDIVIPAIENDALGHTLIIAPPGSAKTNTMMAACEWWLGRDPSQHVAYVCDTATRGVERSLAVRSVIEESPEYRAVFPNTAPNQKRGWSQDAWYLERPNIGDKNPSFLAAGMDTSILGARIDRVVLDDVWNQKIAGSDLEQQRAFTTLERVIMTRLHPTRGRAIGICTRWGEGDFADWAISRGWHVIHIPALTPEGKSYWPQYFPRTWLKCEGDHSGLQCCQYQKIGSASFDQQYMGDVSSNETAKFKSYWWQFYDDEPKEWDRGVIVCDTAGWDAGTKTGDYAAMSVWLRKGDDFYVPECVEDRLEFNDVAKILTNLQVTWRQPILVEDVPWARPLIQLLQKEGLRVIPWKVQGRSKVNRADAVVPIVEAGRVHLPRLAPWRQHWIQQHAIFPYGKHDDLVDNTSMALSYLDLRGLIQKPTIPRNPFKRTWERMTA